MEKALRIAAFLLFVQSSFAPAIIFNRTMHSESRSESTKYKNTNVTEIDVQDGTWNVSTFKYSDGNGISNVNGVNLGASSNPNGNHFTPESRKFVSSTDPNKSEDLNFEVPYTTLYRVKMHHGVLNTTSAVGFLPTTTFHLESRIRRNANKQVSQIPHTTTDTGTMQEEEDNKFLFSTLPTTTVYNDTNIDSTVTFKRDSRNITLTTTSLVFIVGVLICFLLGGFIYHVSVVKRSRNTSTTQRIQYHPGLPNGGLRVLM